MAQPPLLKTEGNGPVSQPTPFQFSKASEILDLRDGQHIYVLNNGGAHSFHTIYEGGRPHPAGKDPAPSCYGHSIGHWDGDTLVIDTVGFNERAWMNRDALPHTDRLHRVERWTRVDFYRLDLSFDPRLSL